MAMKPVYARGNEAALTMALALTGTKQARGAPKIQGVHIAHDVAREY